jgi:hypothetical protein
MTIEIYTLKGFKDFCQERESIRLKKEMGVPANQLTDDEILKNKRFCNISRLHDKGTKKLIEIIEKFNIDEKILTSFYYRLFSSGNNLLLYLKDGIEQFKIRINEEDKIFWHKEYAWPYQVRINGYNGFKDLLLKLFKIEDKILKEIKSWNQNNYINSSIKLRDIINESYPEGHIRSIFPFFQHVLDLDFISPNSINKNSNIFWGAGSASAIKKIAKSLKINYKDIYKDLYKYFDNSLDIVTLEHALCEYDKYCKYRLGLKPLKSKTTNYLRKKNLFN